MNRRNFLKGVIVVPPVVVVCPTKHPTVVHLQCSATDAEDFAKQQRALRARAGLQRLHDESDLLARKFDAIFKDSFRSVVFDPGM